MFAYWSISRISSTFPITTSPSDIHLDIGIMNKLAKEEYIVGMLRNSWKVVEKPRSVINVSNRGINFGKVLTFTGSPRSTWIHFAWNSPTSVFPKVSIPRPTQHKLVQRVFSRYLLKFIKIFHRLSTSHCLNRVFRCVCYVNLYLCKYLYNCCIRQGSVHGITI